MAENEYLAKYIMGDIRPFIPVGPDGKLQLHDDFHFIVGRRDKRIKVTPAELMAVSGKLAGTAEGYISIYVQLMQLCQSMGGAWEGADNLAFVEQITGFSDDLKNMADKLIAASSALRIQAQNYESRQNDNVMQVKKLTK